MTPASDRLLVITVLVGMVGGIALFAFCGRAKDAADRDRAARETARREGIARVRARRQDGGSLPRIRAELESCHAFAATLKRRAHTQIGCEISNPGDELDAARIVVTVIEGGSTSARGASEIALEAKARDEIFFSVEGASDAGPPTCTCAVEPL
jgi:hypothetical protein